MLDPNRIPKYFLEVIREQLSDGSDVYEAMHPELDSVIGQGETVEKAIEDLAGATVAALSCLEEDGIPFPKPMDWNSLMWGLRRDVIGDSERPRMELLTV